jgi:hypothetical protein
MSDDMMPLDGNAAAGSLADLFSVEMTRAVVVCGSCGREGALAELMLYGGRRGRRAPLSGLRPCQSTAAQHWRGD